MHLYMLKLHSHTWQHFDYITMALQLNNSHIIYDYIDATQSMGLEQTSFTHPDYLVIQCWIPLIRQVYMLGFFWGGLHASGCTM